MPPTKRKTPSKPERERRAQQAQENRPQETPNLGRGGGWQRGDVLGVEELHLPSGSSALVRKAQIPELIATGALEKIDMLTPVVDRELVQKARGRQKPKQNELTWATMKPQEMMAALEMSDRVTAAVVVEPAVRLAPTPKCVVCKWEGNDWAEHQPEDKHSLTLEPRDPDVFYTDGIDMQDKLFILDHALGGLRGLENFRSQPDASVANVEAVAGVEDDSG